MIIIYGIKNCDSCKKAVKHFSGVAEFWDVRGSPLSEETLKRFFDKFGEKILNNRSQTWRSLSRSDKELGPIALLKKFPTVMKRPIIENVDTSQLSIGWTEKVKNEHELT
ncbi:MAG: ArsC/Spx/MgsR family protein [Paracoccaceae bacterium]|nr:ArsC/Spx/MgsR family protein [Paracoccaceae bacterium]